MAQRRIGQETFRFGAKPERKTSLDELHALIDWAIAEEPLAVLFKNPKGEKAWPPLAVFKGFLLATWYSLSDVALAEAVADRASFRRFCGFARDEATPERTAFVRFRRHLIARGLDRRLFAAIARDLEAKGAAVRKGTLIDATVIGSAAKGDGEAAWVKHRTRAPDTGIFREVETTPAHEADVNIAPPIIPNEPGEVYADKAYDALAVEKAIEAKGGIAKLLRKGIAGSRPRRSRQIIGRCVRSGLGLKKFLAPGSAATICDRCAGSGLPKQNSKFISRSSLTTSSGFG